ncbi:uncharacterized protein NPIL_351791 [Nephila pilipes]|uniref:Ionotropic receptor n=1 Tax=Nephila pilipes TaxID=299642 RepID=A0A8X6QXR5_NEPPI|nr:uncharacterized protein NPIL_351791 [Nephila pilipes]
MACPKFIRVAIIRSREISPIKNEDGSYSFAGFGGKQLELFLKALNLPFEVVDVEDREYGRLLNNGTWTGIIGMIQQDMADLSIHSVTMTEPKTSVVDFSTVYNTDDMTFAIEKPGTYPTSLAFVRPYDYTVWIPTFTVLLLMPLVLRLLSNIQYTYAHAFIMMLGSFLGQFSFRNTSSRSSKMLIFSWSFFGVIMMLSYSAVLLSILTVPLQIPAVKNFEELSEAVMKRNYKIIVPKGSSTLEALMRNPKKYMRFLGEAAFNNSWYFNGKSLTENGQLNKRIAVVTSRSMLQMIAGPEDWKKYFLSDDSLVSFKFAPAVKKGFCHKKRLDKIVSRINSAGLFLKATREKSFQLWIAEHDKRSMDLDTHPLSINDLIGSFLLLSLGFGLALLSFLCETMCYRLRKKRKKVFKN